MAWRAGGAAADGAGWRRVDGDDIDIDDKHKKKKQMMAGTTANGRWQNKQ